VIQNQNRRNASDHTTFISIERIVCFWRTSARLELTLCFSLALFIITNSPNVGAATVFVSGEGFTSLDNGLLQSPIATQKISLLNGTQRITGSGQSGDFDPQLRFDYVAAANGLAEAGPGVLRAKVSTFATAFSHVPNVPAVIYSPRAQAGFQASFSELVELKHPTLALGSPITFNAVLDVDVASSEPVGFAGTLLVQFGAGPQGGPFAGATYTFPNGLFTGVPDLDFAQTFPIQSFVGAFIVVSTRLSVAGLSRAGPDGLGGTFGGVSSTVIDASNTVKTFLDPVTPGLVFVSESGHDYRLNAVPLPAGLWLFLSALVSTTFRLKRRR
jgi:hypothetical protein